MDAPASGAPPLPPMPNRPSPARSAGTVVPDRIEVELVDAVPALAGAAPLAPLDRDSDRSPCRAGGTRPPRAAAFAAHPDWLRAAATHLLPAGVALARARVDGEEAVRLPLSPRAPGRALRHPAHDHLSLADLDARAGLPGETLLGAVDATLRAAAGRAGTAPAWRAAAVPEDSALVRAVRARTGVATGPLDRDGWALAPARETARFELGDAGAPPLPGKLRRNLRRLRHRLDELAGSGAEMHLHGADDPDARVAAFERFVALEAAGWKSAGAAGTGTAIGDDPATLGFYRELLAPRAPGLAPLVIELRAGGRTVAAKLALGTGATLHLLKIAYDESLGACAPGSLLLESLLERAPERGLGRVSLVTSPAWAARWHPLVAPAWHVVRYADTAGGRLALAADRARGLARRHHRRLRAGRSEP